MNKVAFLITTYNRTSSCKKLVEIISKLGDIFIVNDASEENYEWAEKYNYIKLPKNGGKKMYWKTVTSLFNLVEKHKNEYKYFIMLPDDFITEPNFLNKSINAWKSINCNNKICLNLYTDVGRLNGPCWTNVNPSVFPFARKTQWVDMCFLSESKFFTELDWKIEEINFDWEKNPNMSSGVGAQISRKLHNKDFSLWQTHTSMFRPSDESFNSIMNKHRNKEQTKIHTIMSGIIRVQIASIAEREQMLEKTVKSLRHQVDEIFVGLNGYDHVPDFLNTGEYQFFDNSTGDAVKFYNVENFEGYFFTCDDDLIYPENYVTYMIYNLHKNNSIVSLHGKKYSMPFKSFLNIEKNIRCLEDCPNDEIIDVPGTGALCFHTSQLKLKYNDFKIKNMADIWFAKVAKNQRIKIIALSHSKNYLIYQNPSETIFKEEKQKGFEIQNRILSEMFNEN